MSDYVKCARTSLEFARDEFDGQALKEARYWLAYAQVEATLALVDAQREATAWGKEQVIQARADQIAFNDTIKKALKEED